MRPYAGKDGGVMNLFLGRKGWRKVVGGEFKMEMIGSIIWGFPLSFPLDKIKVYENY